MIYEHLFARVKEPAIVKAGLIGAGQFGAPIVTQAPFIPRLDVPVVADINIEAARHAFRQAGVAEEDIVVCDTRVDALRALEAEKHVVLQDALLMMGLPLDVIASATRSPGAGALYALEAIRHGKHVVMIDKEADSVVGPILKHLADRAGVVFTTDDGDEPGLAMGLVSWARTLGLQVLAGGRLQSGLYDPPTASVTRRGHTIHVPDEERWALERIPAGETHRYAETRRRLFADWRPDQECGDPIAHMAVLANGTGLMPDGPTGHQPVVRYTELPEILCPIEDGGILQTRRAVDVPTVLYTAGEPDPGGGVFVVVANDDPVSREVMIHKGAIANSSGSAMMLYRPYHLCGAETAMSILCAGLLHVPTGSAEVLPRIDMIATTARDFRAGETLGSSGTLGWNHDLRASLVPTFSLQESSPVPFFMLEGNRLTRNVPVGATITLDMTAVPVDSALWSLRRQQDTHFSV
ncbi:MAG: flagellar biosynthesis protein FlgA [Anaerolineae bacterium]|nr:flagellar biosynthesis protein FlgA [Anaerolineae bacterium]